MNHTRNQPVVTASALVNEPVYVFGSTLSGNHEKGQALTALRFHGAEAGKGSGAAGNSYAIPVSGADGMPLPATVIRNYVDGFLAYAGKNPSQSFFVNRLGCEGGACSDAEMAALLKGATKNCLLPGLWLRILDRSMPVRLIVLDAGALLGKAYIQARLDQYLALNQPLWDAPSVELVSAGTAHSVVANDRYARSRGYIHRIIGENKNLYGSQAAAVRDARAVWYATHLLSLSDPDTTSRREEVRLLSLAALQGLAVDGLEIADDDRAARKQYG